MRLDAATWLASICRHLGTGGHLWLLLDYDGTLVPIARTPAEARPDTPLLTLLAQLAQASRIRVAIVSGRPLLSLQEMLPLPGLILAGLYGVEIQMPGRGVTVRAEPQTLRPAVEQVTTAWAELIVGRAGFLLEDKGLGAALHARFASTEDSAYILAQAQIRARELTAGRPVRLLGGDRFLEVAPAFAHKGRAVEWLLSQDRWPKAQVVYFGDNDKDEEAFAVVRARGGVPIGVGPGPSDTHALARIPSPRAVRTWLRAFLEAQA